MTKSARKAPKHTADPVDVLIQYEFTQLMTEHLTDCWQVFDGDFGEMLVLAVLGQAQLGSFLRDKEPIDMDFASRSRGMTASRLSDVSKIPRQTVRRKLAKMKEKGWVTEDENAYWSLAIKDGRPPVREALDGLYLRGGARVRRLVKNLQEHV